MNLGPVLGTVLGLGLAIEIIVKSVRNGFDVHDRVPKLWWSALAVVIGLVSCYAFGINMFKGADISAAKLSALWGQTLTGLAAGGGSGVLHSIMAAWGGGVSGNPKGFTLKRGE